MKGLLVFIALCAVLSARANSLCGSYRNDQPGANRWVIFSDAQIAKVVEKNEIKSLHRVQLTGTRLTLRDLETGQITEYAAQADGSLFETIGKDLFREQFRRDKSSPCASRPAQAVPRCPQPAKDEFACASAAYDKQDSTTLRGLCEQGLPHACLKLADLRDREIRQASSPGPQDPSECAQANSPEDTCGSLLSRSLMHQMVEVSRDAPLSQTWPKPFVEDLMSACYKIGSPALCRQATERAWDAGQYLPAKALLEHTCQLRLGALACLGNQALQRLGTQLTELKPAKTLPCGSYKPLNALGLLRELEFTDRGMVSAATDRMHARVINGMVHVRHDKGADFIFRPIGSQWLLGADPWHRYTVFERQGGKSSCTPPNAADDRAFKDS
jgi:hypothetical protein